MTTTITAGTATKSRYGIVNQFSRIVPIGAIPRVHVTRYPGPRKFGNWKPYDPGATIRGANTDTA